MAKSVFDTAPYDENGLHQLDYNSFFWKPIGLQNYPMLPDPDIAGSRYGIVKQYSVDHRISSAQSSGNHLDGIFLDNIGLTFANVESYRKPLWAYLNTPLSFSYATRRPTAYSGDSMAKFCAALRSYLHGKGLILMGSSSSVSYSWFANVLDVVGGEVQGADPLEKAYTRRALSYGKPWSNLFVPVDGTGAATAPEVLAYLRQALLLGYFPGFTADYWDVPFRLRTRPRPLPTVHPPDPDHHSGRMEAGQRRDPLGCGDLRRALRRPGRQHVLPDGPELFDRDQDLPDDRGRRNAAASGRAPSPSRSSSARPRSPPPAPAPTSSSPIPSTAGETALYEVTVASGCDATYGDLNLDGRADATDLVILSHYLVGNMTPGSAPFTAALAKADCDRSGAVDAVDLVVLQNYLAGNLACLPK